MTYLYEQLGDERFQRLCQAILVSRHPDVQSLPVGQPDGGRDALRRQSGSYVPETVYQVKFSRSPSSKGERDAVEDLIKSESEKVRRLVEQGMQTYFLMTNICGTSHPDAGSIDRVNKRLTEAFGIPSFCYWRDDLDAYVAGNSSVRWAFPEILKATDIIEGLIAAAQGEQNAKRAFALKAYLAHQFDYDSRLKFKQIDLQKGLIDLFVDVPLRLLDEFERRNIDVLRANKSESIPLKRLISSFGGGDFEGEQQADRIKAAFILSDPIVRSACRRVVLEGAPGQGKSTVTQFICQVARIRLLDKEAEFKSLPPSISNSPAAFPFRVDLRDYATWLSGRDPFTTVSGVPTAREGPNQLESFLARQIASCSGGTSFTADDLIATLHGSNILIVLDGFDEVADVEIRKAIVREVREAATRIEANAASSFIIVTSRPSAFANSPGFSKHDWQHIGLVDLDQNTIFAYADKWSEANALEPIDKADLFATLKEKLQLPHVRDLARNPMQLAILLNLINSQGASLPNKRTTLYDRYIETFLDREAEKSDIVRDHRDILLDLHRHLAWTIQAEVEINKDAGNITVVRLKSEVSRYLSFMGHSSHLAEKLFSGMVERVVALVSRVEGTYEFEVQPLREYFAARHLHETVPYIQTGSIKRGSIMDRFEALARNSYWYNVTRFFCGCYSTGELASLVDGLDHINTTKPYQGTDYAPRLSAVLLADYVFTLQPRLIRKVLNDTVISSNFDAFLAGIYEQRGRNIVSLPEDNGRDELVDRAILELKKHCAYDRSYALYRLLKANKGDQAAAITWREISPGMEAERYFREAYYSTAIQNLSKIDSSDKLASYSPSAIRFIYNSDRLDLVGNDSYAWFLITNMYLDDSISAYRSKSNLSESYHHAELSIRLIGDLMKAISRGHDHIGGHDSLWHRINQFDDAVPVFLELDVQWVDFVPFSRNLLELAIQCAGISDMEDANSKEILKSLVETAYKELGPRHIILSAALTIANVEEVNRLPLAEDQASIISKLRMVISLNDSAEFWRSVLNNARCQSDLVLYVQMFLLLSSGNGFYDSLEMFENAVERLDKSEFVKICDIIDELDAPYSDSNWAIPVREYPLSGVHVASARALSLLLHSFSYDKSSDIFLKVAQSSQVSEPGIADVASTLAWYHIVNDSLDLDICIDCLKITYKTGATPNSYSEDDDPALSERAARYLLAVSSSIPLMCVDRASNSIIQYAGERVVPVANIAAVQEWFSCS